MGLRKVVFGLKFIKRAKNIVYIQLSNIHHTFTFPCSRVGIDAYCR